MRSPILCGLFISVLSAWATCSVALPASDAAASAADRTKAQAELRTLGGEIQRLSRVFGLIHEIVAPSVVALHTRSQEPVRVRTPFGGFFYGGQREVEVGEGSGFIFKSDDSTSWILTNAHVVLRTDGGQGFERDRSGRYVPYDRIAVELNDGRQIDAQYVGISVETDLAVMKISLGKQPVIEFTDSDRVHVGDWVLALGYPLGVGYSATSGIVSATDRSTGIYAPVGGFESFIQTDAAINPGNSGGPLVDITGRLIGVNSSIKSGTGANIGLGFAIPSNLVRRVADDLVAHGDVRWPAIGVELAQPDDASRTATAGGLPPSATAVVARVFPGSPAAEAGLKDGDVVLAVGGVRVQGAMQFRTRLATCRVGQAVELTLWRDGTETTRTVTPISRTDMQKLHSGAGPKISDETELAGFGLTLGLDGQAGALITAVDPDGLAAQAGLEPGNRLLAERSLGKLTTAADLERLAKRQEIVVQIWQDGRTLWLRMRR